MSIDYKQEFIKDFKTLLRNKHPYEVWKDTITLFAIEINNTTMRLLKSIPKHEKVWNEREQRYISIAGTYNKKERVEVFPKMFTDLVLVYEQEPFQDLLGDIYMRLDIRNKKSGQFFTPYSVSQLMAACNTDIDSLKSQIEEQSYVNVSDSACGAGSTLIAFAERLHENNINYQTCSYFAAQDVDETVAMMCYIQLSLLGCAGYVAVGNSLIEPVVTDLSRLWFTPMWFTDIWTARRMSGGRDLLFRQTREAKLKEMRNKLDLQRMELMSSV